MAWRLIEIPDDTAQPTDLTDGELIGVRVILAQYMGEGGPQVNVYARAYSKLGDAAEIALNHDD
jgi:hypothetical protein